MTVLAREWGNPSMSVGEVTALGCLLAALVRTAVTFQEVRSLHEMRQQAATDDLTGLPNRRALLHRVDALLRTGRPAALFLLDLDGFKAVNDGLGHQAGDQLLRELGDRIRPACGPPTCWLAWAVTSSPRCYPASVSTTPATAPSGCTSWCADR